MSKYLNKKFAMHLLQLENKKEKLEEELTVIMREVKKPSNEDKQWKQELVQRQVEVEDNVNRTGQEIDTLVKRTMENIQTSNIQPNDSLRYIKAVSAAVACASVLFIAFLFLHSA